MEEKKYIFGPVASRRLGLSLGVDIVPLKTCTLNCVYCQLGASSQRTIERKDYVPIEEVLIELSGVLKESVNKPDYITLSGSGEPTLNSQLGELICRIKEITDIPVAVMTNGTLFYDPAVREDCCHADLVLPSLDAGDEQTFERINRPHKSITLETLLEGLIAFRNQFAGQIWLEIFLIEEFNTTEEQISKISDLIGRIKPNKVQLNTAARPTAEKSLKKVPLEKMTQIARQLGPKAEVVAEFSPKHLDIHGKSSIESMLKMLKRRPCSLSDICTGLGIRQNEAIKYIACLESKGLIRSVEKNGQVFFIAQ